MFSDIDLQFSFFVASGFGIKVMVASQNEFGNLPSSAIFWKSLSRIGVSSSLNFWQNSAVKPSGPGLLFAGRFLITVSISMLVLGLLIFSISSWFSFGKLYFSKNLSIPSRLSILLAYNCSQSNRAKSTEPLAGSHCCALLLCTLPMQQVLLSHCLVPQWAPSISNQLSMSNPQLSCSAIGQHCSGPCPLVTVSEEPLGSDSVKGRWCGGHQVESEVRDRFRPSGASPAYPALGQWMSWKALGNRLGTLSYKASEPSLRPPLAVVQALRQRWTCPHPCLCDPIAVAVCVGCSL